MKNERNRKIFVAGAAGAIGRRLCLLLVDDDWVVLGSTRSQEKAELLHAMDVEPVLVDVFDQQALLDVVCAAQPGIVIHQLTDLPHGLDPARMSEARIRNARIREIGTGNLVAAAIAAGVQRMIAQSIAFAYAPGPTPYHEDAPLNLAAPEAGATARAVASLEHQVLSAPFEAIVLRYGKLYGPGTGFDNAQGTGSLHVDAAADAARRAVIRGGSGVYNIADNDGTVSISKAATSLGWSPAFRMDVKKR